MKINLLKKAIYAVVVISTLAIASCSNPTSKNADAENSAESNTPKFEDASVNNVYQHYIHLKTALVNNDDQEAKNGAKMLTQALTDAGNTEIASQANEIKSAADIEAKRSLFNALSENLTNYLKQSKLASGVIYRQYCPMANNDQGGYWLSSEKEIRNPYYGDQMLKCGTVEEEIK
jgi:hypothetical protein